MHIYRDDDFLWGIVLIELFSIEVKLSLFKEFENISLSNSSISVQGIVLLIKLIVRVSYAHNINPRGISNTLKTWAEIPKRKRNAERCRREAREKRESERGESTKRVWRTTLRVQATLRFQDSRILYLQNGRPTGRRWEVEHSWEYWKRHFEVSKKGRFIISLSSLFLPYFSLFLFLYSTHPFSLYRSHFLFYLFPSSFFSFSFFSYSFLSLPLLLFILLL